MLCRGPGPAWLVLYTAPRGEREAMAGVVRTGMQAWTPIERYTALRHGKRVEFARPYFPRYCFAGIRPDRDDWRRLEDVDGVEQVLTNDGRPMRVPGAVIAALRHAENVGAFDRTRIEPNGFELGETVRVGEGQFSGFRGIIEEFMAKMKSATASKRAKLLVEFMGRVIRIEIPVEHLEKL